METNEPLVSKKLLENIADSFLHRDDSEDLCADERDIARLLAWAGYLILVDDKQRPDHNTYQKAYDW